MICEVSNTRDFTERGWVVKNVLLPSASRLASPTDNSKLDCMGLKVDPFCNRWAFIAVFGVILKWKSHARP